MRKELKMETIGLIGAGTMGKPMATNWLKAGYGLLAIVHRNRAPIEELVKLGAREVDSYGDIAALADVIVLNLPSSIQVEEVLYSPGNLIDGLTRGTRVIDMGTSDPSSTIKIAKDLAKRGVEMLDSPVSGGEAGAVKASLSVMVGGKRSVFESTLPLLRVIGSTIVYVGDHGMGHTMKLLNNMVGVGNLVLLSEVLSLAEVLGVDLEIARQVMAGGSANSAALGFWGTRLVNRDYSIPTYRFSLAAKDMRLAQSMAATSRMTYPVFSAIHQIITIADAMGLKDEDVCGLKGFWDNLIDGRKSS
jgi:2-hydroxy-3-oxopropionate reductase